MEALALTNLWRISLPTALISPDNKSGILFFACIVALLLAVCISALFVVTQVALFQRATFPDSKELKGLQSFFVRHAHDVALVLRLGKIICAIAFGAFAIILSRAFFHNWHWCGLLLLFLSLISFFVLSGVYLPRRLGLNRPERTLKAVAPFVLLSGVLLYPWAWLLRRIGGCRTHKESIADSAMRLEALVGLDRLPDSPYLRSMMERAGNMEELELADVLVPRDAVVYFDITLTLQENFCIAKKSGHTRFPLCQGELDKCIGVIHIKDVFGKLSDKESVNLEQIRRPLVRFSSRLSLEIALRRLLAARLHMAVVQDEFGGIIGLVTLEDIFEQLIGDIDDEFDTPERDLVVSMGKGRWEVDALVPLHELNASIGRSLEGEGSATFGGFLTERIGRIPKTGEKIDLEDVGLEVKISSASSKRILLTEVALKT